MNDFYIIPSSYLNCSILDLSLSFFFFSNMASLGALRAKRRGVEEQHRVGQDALEGGASAAPSAARLRMPSTCAHSPPPGEVAACVLPAASF